MIARPYAVESVPRATNITTKRLYVLTICFPPRPIILAIFYRIVEIGKCNLHGRSECREMKMPERRCTFPSPSECHTEVIKPTARSATSQRTPKRDDVDLASPWRCWSVGLESIRVTSPQCLPSHVAGFPTRKLYLCNFLLSSRAKPLSSAGGSIPSRG